MALRKVMLTIFFRGTSLISLDTLRQDQTYTQEYFIHNILLDLVNEKRRIWRRDRAGRFFVHVANSVCHNGGMITSEISDAKFRRLPHAAYSLDLSPCDF
jgi:hypothetical protein